MRKQLLLSTLFIPLVIALSCEKNKADPECRDASCCHPEYNRFVEYIENVPASLNGYRLTFAKYYPSNSLLNSNSAAICENSLDKIKGFEADTSTTDSIKYSYRVSGKILEDYVNPRFAENPIHSIYIDKIEKIN
ncbi:hypothetical protein [Dyadobacter bucti]|uniref:hypothetical protein n=1 Tax=Dyadobacter bucti TaxID=2572203 RepID=UPI003F6FC739